MSTTPRRRVLVAAIGSPRPYCGEAMAVPDRPPSRDHIRPRSKGYGLDGNLALVCCRCNIDKGSLSLGQWLTRLSRAGDARAGHVLRSLSVGRPLKSPVTRSHRKMQMPA
jgi:hypothetical protein